MAETKAKKFKFGSKLSSGAKNKEPGIKQYAGEKPPPGPYRLKLRRLFMDENSGGPVMRYLAEVDEDRPDKKKFNGYPIWGGQNIVDEFIGYFNNMLIAFGDGDSKYVDAFYDTGGEVVTRADGKNVQHVVKIGDARIDPTKIMFIGVCADNRYKPKGGGPTQVNLQVSSYVPLSESTLGSTTADDDDDDPDIVDAEVDEDEAEEVAEDEGDESEEEYAEDDFLEDD